MATKVIKVVKGRKVRLTKLDNCGAHVVGSCSSLVTEGFISVILSGEWEEGEDFSQKNAWGDFCVAERDEPRLKWINVAMLFCEVHPDAVDFIGGGAINPVVAGADTVGFTHGQNPNGAGVAVEVWSKLAGNACTAGAADWGYTAIPFVKNGRLDGDVHTGRTGATFGARGDGQPAPSTWGVTPYADNPLLRTLGFPAGDIWGMVRTTVQPPATTVSCAALA